MLSYPGKIFTRIQLMDEIWGSECETGWETVTVHVARLRKRFEGWQEFEIEAGYITRGGMKVPVFEVRAHYNTYLNGLDKQRIRNATAEREDLNKYPGMKVGSMTEPLTDGNWENL